jgi:hypothetical protein
MWRLFERRRILSKGLPFGLLRVPDYTAAERPFLLFSEEKQPYRS